MNSTPIRKRLSKFVCQIEDGYAQCQERVVSNRATAYSLWLKSIKNSASAVKPSSQQHPQGSRDTEVDRCQSRSDRTSTPFKHRTKRRAYRQHTVIWTRTGGGSRGCAGVAARGAEGREGSCVLLTFFHEQNLRELCSLDQSEARRTRREPRGGTEAQPFEVEVGCSQPASPAERVGLLD